jgi:DNA-binding NtrC family response regulator
MGDKKFYAALGRLRMVVVEDDPLLRDTLALFFRTKGCPILAFGSAEEAMPVLEAKPPDIVICDQWLPGMDGLTLLKRIGTLAPDAGRVLFSANLNTQVAEEGRRDGINEYLLKPFSIEEMEQVLMRLLQLRPGCGTPSKEEIGEMEGDPA